ncbi:hypothetical protein PENANT_c005G05899 [Penicillium antarcticum]|uniref:Uncharacterized protein n=1 Tax=Penicillium antarcticum TaxID=416450 RepID=A0A1V6QFM3_9EURO|nr:hypothetical protein PENANT_c005G05899 [Penicillium antarcticum]
MSCPEDAQKMPRTRSTLLGPEDGQLAPLEESSVSHQAAMMAQSTEKHVPRVEI